VLLLIASVLTTMVYPVLYTRLIAGDGFTAVLLGLRNAVIVAVFVWAIVRLCRAAFEQVQIPLGTRPLGSTIRSTSY
jgi:hypothetical protein